MRETHLPSKLNIAKNMPRATQASSAPCNHANLGYSSSSHAAEAGYRRPTTGRGGLAAPTSRAQKVPAKQRNPGDEADEHSKSFPAPLILPSDELSLDPRYPAQSLQDWIGDNSRREVTPQRRTIYVAAPPGADPEVEFVRGWAMPNQKYRRGRNSVTEEAIIPPQVEDIVSYLKAFYHGMCVKALPPHILRFASWDSHDAGQLKRGGKSTAPDFLGLNTLTESVRIQCRPSTDGLFKRQLNLNDLLDVAISILPKDAHALVLLVSHDLFEDADDVFVCGRAYGGSGVAVISMARYHPSIDGEQNIEREHAWPASHCEKYMQKCCEKTERTKVSEPSMKSKKGTAVKEAVVVDLTDDGEGFALNTIGGLAQSPLRAAVSAHNALPSLASTLSCETLSGLWLGRVCRTVSHELGHCFGIDHCVYYACSMQGSASIIEDARQPPYLCPVDLSKVLRATGAEEGEQYEALLRYCDLHQDVHMFAAFAAWIRGILG